MIRVHCNQDDKIIPRNVRSVEISYILNLGPGETRKHDNLAFCDEMCASVYFANIGREATLRNELD